MGDIIKRPQQTRSIETKRRIVEAGFRLLRKQGYYHVTTADIAKEAGVSTGILYRYFNNKMDIFKENMSLLVNEKVMPAINKLDIEALNETNLVVFLNELLDEIDQLHEDLGAFHNDMQVMLQEKEVLDYFVLLEKKIADRLAELLGRGQLPMEHAREKIYLIYGLVEKYSHEHVLQKRQDLNPDILKTEVIKTLVLMILGKSDQ